MTNEIPPPTPEDLATANHLMGDYEGIVRCFGGADSRAVFHRCLAAERRGREAAERALGKINDVRNSIIGSQQVNWSEHIYPLVAALNEAGIDGMSYPDAKERFATMMEKVTAAESRVAALEAALRQAQIVLETIHETHVGPSTPFSRATAIAVKCIHEVLSEQSGACLDGEGDCLTCDGVGFMDEQQTSPCKDCGATGFIGGPFKAPAPPSEQSS